MNETDTAALWLMFGVGTFVGFVLGATVASIIMA
jgi:hypothetical protein